MLILFMLLILILAIIFTCSLKRSEKKVDKILSQYVNVKENDKIRIKIKEISRHRGSSLITSHEGIKVKFPFVSLSTVDRNIYLDDFIMVNDSIIKLSMNDTIKVKRNFKEYSFIIFK
jgi:hypothetical protein